MSSKLKILATISARGGSKGVPGKNIRSLLGKPLIAHTILQAKESSIFDKIIVSTDSDEIANIAREWGAEVPFKRPENLAQDTSPKYPDVIRHALLESEKSYNTQFELIVELDPTSPLREVEDIRKSVAQLIESDAPNLITAMPARRSPYFNLVELDSLGRVRLSKPLQIMPRSRQESPRCFDMNASIYVWKRETVLKENSIFLDQTALYVMPPERSIDIDDEIDFQFVEFIFKKKMGTFN